MCKFLTDLFKKTDKPLENIIESENTDEEPEAIEETIEEDYNNKNENDMEMTNPEPYVPSYNGKIILLDNGHGKNCAGKCSPKFEDGSQFFEYEFSRDIVRRIANKLDEIGVLYRILVPEVDEDIKLTERARRANEICAEYGKENCIFISVHANAAGNGSEWKNARGWSVWTTKGDTKSDAIATIFFEEAEKILPQCGMTLRKDTSDGDPDYEENFTVIYKTVCPAILTENLFMDNKTDVEFLMSDEGRNKIAQIHVNAIKRLCFY